MEIIDLSLLLSKNNLDLAKKFLSLFPFSYNEVNVTFFVNNLEDLSSKDFTDLLKFEKKVGEFNYCLFDNIVEVKLSSLNKKWLNYFQKNDIKLDVNLSYKDDVSFLKSYDNINTLIIHLKKEEFDLSKVNDTYKKYQIPLDIKVEGVNDSTLFNDDELSKKMKEYFPIWLKDVEGTLFVPYRYYVDISLGGTYKLCINDSCIGKNFYMDEEGNLFTCNKACLNKYCYGNMKEVTSLDDIYLAKNFERFVSENIARRNKCLSCSLFKKCQGGCAADSILKEGRVENINKNYCKNYQEWSEFAKSEIQKITKAKVGLKELNPSFRSLIIDSLKMDIRL